ncbi:integrase catalytic domain-containing protein [Trichonephila clavata]|uniref:Integrase catalytic domain-containing protein n=1 Tax=Trichonephila clavata TaxID=2740835 RepID=A0A8X6GF96_TRICU|nr:integrase catalytic domain-containing protein [Trichonephila clavata]
MSTSEKLSILKRKRTMLRAAITKLSTKLNDPNSRQADIEFNTERLQIKLNELTLADDEIHDFLNDQEYSEDITECEKYSENAHLLLFNSKKKANTSVAILPCSRIGSLPTSDSIHYAPSTNVTVKLPTIDKHVILRGYLDSEAKRLVDGISITADTYTMTKEILKSKNGKKDKIIPAHLDYLKNLTAIKYLSPSALNELYIDCNRRLQALDPLGEKTQSYGERVFITGSNGITKFTSSLLDGGSQSSFISSDLVNTLNLPVISTGILYLQAIEFPTSFSHKRRQVQFQLSSIWDKSKVNVIAFESSNRYASHPSSPTEVSRFAKSKRMKLADPDDSLSSLPIEILIGADFYWNVMHSDAPVKLSDSLALVPSSFGWILSGSRSHAAVSFNPIVHSINVDTFTHDLDNMVRNFWNLESIGKQPIQEKLRLSTHNAELLTDFHKSFKIIDGRRVVNFPWKPEVKLTSSNYDTAIHRFNSWTRRIHTNTELKQKYAKQMQDYIDKKQVEAVLKDTQNEVRLFYLPHHAVKKIKNEGIKWRIVLMLPLTLLVIHL